LLLPVPVELYVTLLLTIWASIGLGLWVSALVPNRDVVVYGMLLVLIIQIIFAGVLFELPREVRSVSGITITRWSLDALGTSARLNELNQYGRSRVLPNISKEVEKEVEIDIPNPLGGSTKQTQTVKVTVEYNDPINTRIAPDFQLLYGCVDKVTRTNDKGETEQVSVFNEPCSRGSLIGNWLVLAVFAAGFTGLAAGTLKLKERTAR
jgi:hypothetical protein